MLKWIKKFFLKKYTEGLKNENKQKSFIEKTLSKIKSSINFNFRLYILRDKQYLAYKNWIKDYPTEEPRYNYILNENSLVYDVGGYHGDFSYKIFEKHGCYVNIFEPFPQFFKIIKNRFKDNKKITCYDIGLSNKDENMLMNDAGLGTSLKKSDDINLNSDGETVKVRNITNHLLVNDIKKIDLMKLNVEGSEYEIIPELIKTGFIKKITNLQVQFHRNYSKNEYHKIREQLKQTHELTFEYFMIWENWTLVKDSHPK